MGFRKNQWVSEETEESVIVHLPLLRDEQSLVEHLAGASSLCSSGRSRGAQLRVCSPDLGCTETVRPSVGSRLPHWRTTPLTKESSPYTSATSMLPYSLREAL
jgi:hypothetical protein